MRSLVALVEGEIDPLLSDKKAGVVPTLGDNELELKLDLSDGERDLQVLTSLMDVVRNCGIHRSRFREEMHVVFFTPSDAHHTEIIYRTGSKVAHIKKKELGSVLRTPKGLTLLYRAEEHYKPKGSELSGLPFQERMADLICSNSAVGSFQKRTADFQFFLEDLGFTLSVSDIESHSKDEGFSQAEIEYIGHRSSAKPPPFDRIPEAFDVIASRLSPLFHQCLSTRSKLQWLIDAPPVGTVF